VSAEPVERPSNVTDSRAEDGAQRLVAILVILVTLLGAVFAFLHTQAGSREASAARESQASSIQAMSHTIAAERRKARNNLAYELSTDQDWLGYSLGEAAQAGGEAAAYLRALARAHDAASKEAARHAPVLADETFSTNGGVDWTRFDEEQQRTAYGAAQFEKAYAEQREGWSRKSSEYVTVITVFAVSLFLLGLSLTVQNGARRTLMGIGVAVALAGAAWGASIWARSVEEPSRDAVAAYVDGLIALQRADYSEVMDASQRRRTLTYAVTRFTDAVELRPTYADAFMDRAAAHFELFELDPQGGEADAALADYERVIALGTDDQYSRGSLAAVQWWQGDYEAATANTEAALRFDRTDLTLNLNYAEMLNLADSRREYEAQLEAVRDILRRTPSWLRDSTMTEFTEAVDVVIRSRPEFAEQELAFKQDLAEIQAELARPATQ
jgi:tetratricopeptide (TPR) repeat protein